MSGAAPNSANSNAEYVSSGLLNLLANLDAVIALAVAVSNSLAALCAVIPLPINLCTASKSISSPVTLSNVALICETLSLLESICAFTSGSIAKATSVDSLGSTNSPSSVE